MQNLRPVITLLPLCPNSLCRLENMIILSQICLSKQKFLGKFNGIVIKLSSKFELHRNRIENIPPFPATRAFFSSGNQVPAEISNRSTMALAKIKLPEKLI